MTTIINVDMKLHQIIRILSLLTNHFKLTLYVRSLRKLNELFVSYEITQKNTIPRVLILV